MNSFTILKEDQVCVYTHYMLNAVWSVWIWWCTISFLPWDSEFCYHEL